VVCLSTFQTQKTYDAEDSTVNHSQKNKIEIRGPLLLAIPTESSEYLFVDHLFPSGLFPYVSCRHPISDHLLPNKVSISAPFDGSSFISPMKIINFIPFTQSPISQIIPSFLFEHHFPHYPLELPFSHMFPTSSFQEK
jgi:hypothetical protein